MHRRIPLSMFILLLVASWAHAGWSDDPLQNLPVADEAGDQILPKLTPTSDGGCYVSWFDNIANGFDVRVQLLDSAGDEVLPHNGVLVADRSFSSVQDYGLDTDASGNALLAFRDDRPGGEQITAAKVMADGSQPWGASGVQLTNTMDFVAAPKVAGTSDGGAVAAWTQETDVHIQKLDADGNPAWDPEIIFSPGAGSYSVSDLHAHGDDVIISMVHQTGSFGSPRHILAQKLGPDGNLLWDPGHVAVFDGGSVQFGNFPPFIPDQLGGGVFFWYDAATSQLQCYVQHVLADGTEAFGHNGSAVSTVAARVRVNPWACFDPATGETFAFWREQSSNQAMDGLYGQKFDAVGSRQWTDQGMAYIPVGSDQIDLVRSLVSGDGAFVFWSRTPSFGQDRLYGMHVDGDGNADIAAFDVASTPSGKSRLDAEQGAAGFAILAWSDDRNDEGDVLAQNVNSDGTLGPPSSGVGAADLPGQVRLGAPWPNPTRGQVHADYRVSRPGRARLAIYDLQGRLVREIEDGAAGEAGRVTWDGRDGRGAGIEVGVYFLRLRVGSWTEARRIIVLR